MIEEPDDIDAAVAELQRRTDQLDAKIDEMKVEQLAGRTGLPAYLEAKRLQAEVNACAAKLSTRLQQIMRDL